MFKHIQDSYIFLAKSWRKCWTKFNFLLVLKKTNTICFTAKRKIALNCQAKIDGKIIETRNRKRAHHELSSGSVKAILRDELTNWK